MPASLPTPDGVVYAPPNPDGSAKACRNCYLWDRRNERCAILAKSVRVVAGQVCGYHLFGRPTSHPHLQVKPISAKLAGLEYVGKGTCCGNCRFFRGDRGGGRCMGVVASPHGPQAKVEFLGCCARWEAA